MAVTLRTGHKVPPIGLGTFKAPSGEVKTVVKEAFKIGYRNIDCASAYMNEPEIGEAIEETITSGLVKREELFITSKLWNTDHHAEDVKKACVKSLKSLHVDYLDLYLIHWPVSYKPGDECFPMDKDGKIIYDDTDYLETWQAMEKLVDEGLVAAIGLSNFNKEQVQRVLDNCRIKPAMLQIEVHPYLPSKELVELCHSNDIQVTAFAPLGSPGWKGWAGFPYDESKLMEDSRIVAIAEKHGKLPSQVLLRYLVQRDIVPIPKSVNPLRLKSNLEVFDFEISEEDMHILNNLGVTSRRFYPPLMWKHKYYPWKEEIPTGF